MDLAELPFPVGNNKRTVRLNILKMESSLNTGHGIITRKYVASRNPNSQSLWYTYQLTVEQQTGDMLGNSHGGIMCHMSNTMTIPLTFSNEDRNISTSGSWPFLSPCIILCGFHILIHGSHKKPSQDMIICLLSTRQYSIYGRENTSTEIWTPHL